MSDTQALLVLPHLRIQNANAVSGPHTWGFPSMTAFVGLMHALERKLAERERKLQLDGVGVVCHHYETQASRAGFANKFHLTRNPVNHKGETAAIVEEGRIHLDISLVFDAGGDACHGSDRDRTNLLETINELVGGMRIAGGSVVPASMDQPWENPARLIALSDDPGEEYQQIRKLMRQMLPGFTLVLRNDLLHSHWEELRDTNLETTLLDAWLDLSRLNVHAISHSKYDSQEEVEWQVRRPPGWIVPIPIGYGALTEVFQQDKVANARDTQVPFRFVESLFSIGEWISPHRLKSLDDFLWYPESDVQNGLYCINNYYSSRKHKTAQ